VDSADISRSRSYLTLERKTSYFFQFDLVIEAIGLLGGDALEVMEIGGSNNVPGEFALHFIPAKYVTFSGNIAARGRGDCVDHL
jgi:hypothetical protein